MRRIYLDNAATSYPKAPGTAEAVYDFMKNMGVSINRTCSTLGYDETDDLFDLRSSLKKMFKSESEDYIFFTQNVTQSLNTVIRGLISQGDHVIVSPYEHNAVMRTLTECGIGYSTVAPDGKGRSDFSTFDSLVTGKTKAVIFNMASNVSGAIQDIATVCECAKKHDLILILDCAQSIPMQDVDMKGMGVDVVCFTGHKGLLGPQGTGGIITDGRTAEMMRPLMFGGTGSVSDSMRMPDVYPDRFEAGTLNLAGLYGLKNSVEYVIDNLEDIRRKEREISSYFLERMLPIDGIRIIGPKDIENRTSTFSITSDKADIAYIADQLLRREGIETRVGLHCAPLAHMSLGTYPTGTLRISPGIFTTRDDIDITAETIRKIIHG